MLYVQPCGKNKLAMWIKSHEISHSILASNSNSGNVSLKHNKRCCQNLCPKMVILVEKIALVYPLNKIWNHYLKWLSWRQGQYAHEIYKGTPLLQFRVSRGENRLKHSQKKHTKYSHWVQKRGRKLKPEFSRKWACFVKNFLIHSKWVGVEICLLCTLISLCLSFRTSE